MINEILAALYFGQVLLVLREAPKRGGVAGGYFGNGSSFDMNTCGRVSAVVNEKVVCSWHGPRSERAIGDVVR